MIQVIVKYSVNERTTTFFMDNHEKLATCSINFIFNVATCNAILQDCLYARTSGLTVKQKGNKARSKTGLVNILKPPCSHGKLKSSKYTNICMTMVVFCGFMIISWGFLLLFQHRGDVFFSIVCLSESVKQIV